MTVRRVGFFPVRMSFIPPIFTLEAFRGFSLMVMFRRLKVVMGMRRKFFRFVSMHWIRPLFLFLRLTTVIMFRRNRLRMFVPGRFHPVMPVRRARLITVTMLWVRTHFSRRLRMIVFRRRRFGMFVPG